MADIFLKEDVIKLLKNKFVLMMGDSNMRCIYKDIIWLMETGNITPVKCFHAAMAKSRFCGDKIVDRSKISNGRDYYEIREYKNKACENLLLRYHFITRVYGKSVEIALDNIEKGITPAPKIVILNSCLWDLNRWGPKQEDAYKSNLVKLFQRLRSILPDDSMVLWLATPPVSCEVTKGGLFIQQLQFMKHSLRFMIMEANLFVQQLCVAFEYDVLDLHYHMRHQLNSRAKDGIHWEPHAMRHISNLLLTHLALSFEMPLPNLVTNRYIMAAKNRAVEAIQGVEVDIHLDKSVLEEVFGKNAVSVSTKEQKTIQKKSTSSLAIIKSTEENIVTAIADTTSPPVQSLLKCHPENKALKNTVSENENIKSPIKTNNSLKDDKTSQNVSINSNLSNNSISANNSNTKRKISSTGISTSPIACKNNLKKQSSGIVSTSSSTANTTVSPSAVSSSSDMQHIVKKEGSASNKLKNREIKTAKRRLINTIKEEKALAQQDLEQNVEECILNILNDPDSTTSQILLDSIDNIGAVNGKKASPVNNSGEIRGRGTPRGQSSVATGSVGTARGMRVRGDTVNGFTTTGMQPQGRGLPRVGTLGMFQNEGRGLPRVGTLGMFQNEGRDLPRVGTLDMFQNQIRYGGMNSENCEFMEWGDQNWREGMEWDGYNTRNDLVNIDFTSDDVLNSIPDSQRFDNLPPRNSVLDRLGSKLPSQPGFNDTGFRSREEMLYDHYSNMSQNTSMYRACRPNQQNNAQLNNFYSESQHPDSYYQNETSLFNRNSNHQYLQQFNSYLQTNQQRFPSQSIGPQQRGPPPQWVGPRQWADPFWNNYPTDNFPWNNRY